MLVEIIENDLAELPFKKAQYLLSIETFQKVKNLRFGHHIVPFLPRKGGEN
jgi:hypothetical protein